MPEQARETSAPWLVLLHQLPPEPSYLRVKVRRRLQAVGALPLKNSVYVLPASDEALEDFQWLRRWIEDEGAWARILSAGFVDGGRDAEIRQLFLDDRQAAYERIRKAARRAARSGASSAEGKRLERALAKTVALDFFGAPGRGEAAAAVEALAPESTEEPARRSDSAVEKYRNRTWVTRAGLYVDRLSCAWFIRRFVDPAARFRFVRGRSPRTGPDEIRFDMYEGEFTHRGEDCTFEGMVSRFRPDDDRLRALAEIVHDIDCKDENFGRPEAAGVRAALDGLVAGAASDEERLERGLALFDALYAGLRSPD